MATRATTRSKRTAQAAEITRGLTAPDIERLLTSILGNASDPPPIRLARNLGDNFFIDTWVSILLGTVGRKSDSFTVVDWSEHQGDLTNYEPYIYSSIPAVTALSLGAKFTSSDHKNIPLTRDQIALAICSRRLPTLPDEDGFLWGVSHPVAHIQPSTSPASPSTSPIKIRSMLHDSPASSNTVCEFDPLFSLSDLFSGGKHHIPSAEEQRLFKQRMSTFIRDLEFGSIPPEQLSNADELDEERIQPLLDFLLEAHENSCLFGLRGRGTTSLDQRPILPGVRFVRLQKYLGANSALIDRASGIPPLREYLRNTLKGESSAIIEGSVSDFGLGIVEFIRSSVIGQWHEKQSASHILDLAFRGRVTTRRGDPAAGKGIYKALQAVRGVGGFVSLRSDKFWLYRDFSISKEEEIHRTEMSDMLPDEALSTVAGTHWLFLYSQSLTRQR